LPAHEAVPITSQRSKTTWSPWAREYARTPERYVFGTAPSDFALEVARLIRPGDYVLDLGCGEGRDSVFFAERGAVVTGIDLSAEGIAKARRLARARGVRVTWWQGSMTELLPPGLFDLIFSCGSIHYVPRARRGGLFARLKAMTRPNGHQAHLVFTDRLVHEEKGEIVEYFNAGELHEAFVEWQIRKRGESVIRCGQDGTVHGHAVEELVAARPPGRAPRPSEP
jgi:tellurite methyltransferase